MQSRHRTHRYAARLVWTGNLGTGTADYAGYGRAYTVYVAGKPELEGSADPVFRGDATRYNPEDLFVAAVSACHMLTYLSLCARRGVRVLSYEDHATGTLALEADGGGQFTEIRLNPDVRIASGGDADLAHRLHDEAHEGCFIARSCNAPIRHHATIAVATSADPDVA